METLAAVMTGSGTSAIATLEVLGPDALDILARVFAPSGAAPLTCQIGSIRIGTLHDNQRPIDQITLGCEGQCHWALHCHGNPLIAQAAMALLKAQGVTPVTAQELRTRALSNTNMPTCHQEACLALAHCRTLLGARLLEHQRHSGLSHWALTWQHNTGADTQDLHAQCRVILAQSRVADQILNGITVALIGPPNSGKSTLLNSLSGQDAAIVTAIKGTTRDWVEADCRTERLALHLIDTAGLDTALQEAHLDAASQQRTLEVIHRAHLILVVLDQSQHDAHIESHWLEQLPRVPRITVLNKSDLPCQLNRSDLGMSPTATIAISAKYESGLKELLHRIEHTLGVADFDITQPLCVTPRQRQCVEQVLACRTLKQAQDCLELLLRAR